MFAGVVVVQYGTIVNIVGTSTENTMEKIKHLLDYATTRPNTIITYSVSDMVLAAHSDTFYLSESKV